MFDVESFWYSLEKAYQAILSMPSFDVRVKTTHPLKSDNNQSWLEVPSTVHRDYWEKDLSAEIVETGSKLTSVEVMPHFIAADEKGTVLAQKLEEPAEEEVVFSEQSKRTMLNPRYTFGAFVIGRRNQAVYVAALVVAEDPGLIYNPLFFYGGVGLGKTRLMHAIDHQMSMNRPNVRVKYVSNEMFTSEFTSSIQTETSEQFRKKYRNVDLLLVDDVQFLTGKEATLEKFFHIFNNLYNENKQIVLTGNRPLNDILKLSERLVSRFAWGLSVDITPPDLETQIVVLRKKTDTERLEIPDDTLSYIAGQIDSNIRELEGVLVRVQTSATINGEDIITSLATDVLKPLKSVGSKSQLSILQVQEEVSKYHHVPLKDLKGKKRVETIVVPRQILMYPAREMIDNSLPKVGAEPDGKDYTAVIHAYEKIQQLLEKDPAIQKEVSEIKSSLNSQDVKN